MALAGRLRKILVGCIGLVCSTAALASDIQISQLTDSPDPAIRGGEITYSIAILNSANDTANDVMLSMPLPLTTSFVSVNNGACIHNGGSPGTVICNLGSVTGDGLGNPVTNIDLVIRSSAATGGTLAFTATGSTSSADTNPANDSLTQNTTINDGADLVTSVSDSSDPVIAGSNLTYTITAQNLGPNDAASVSVVNTLPVGMSYVSASGAGWSCGVAGQNVTCTRASINDGASAPNISIVGQIIGAINGTITNVVAISATTGDPVPNNNTTTEDTLVDVGADLTITKTASSPVIGGGAVTFTLAPRNNGPFEAATVVVTDTIPGNVAYVSATGIGWSCSHSGELLGGTVTCNRAAYSVGASNDITIGATAPATGGFTNNASISSATADPTPGNNSDTSVSTVVPDGADLRLTKSKTPDPVAQGSDMTSTIRVTNLGPQATSGVLTVTDTLAAGETYVSFSGANWVCNHNAVNPGGVATCTYSATPLAASASASNLSIVTTATNAGSLSNSASVSDAGGQPDGVPGNNSGSASVTSTVAIADLSITKALSTSNANTVLENNENTQTYTLTLTNNGPNDLTDPANATIDDAVVITDVIPRYISGVVGAAPSATPVIVVDDSVGGKFICSTGSTLTCRLRDGQTLANAEVVVFTVSVSRPLRNGAFTNTATVSSSVLGDNNAGNNSASVGGTIDPVADVEVQTLTVTPDPVEAGTEATYVVTFRNNGPSSAANVDLVNTFSPPAGRSYTLVSATPSKGGCGALAGNVLTCNIGSLSRNETETLTMVVRPDWDILNSGWTLGALAAISTTTAESNAGNNSVTVNLGVDPAELDLLVNKTDLTDPIGFTPTPVAFPGSLDNVIVYRVDTTNGGPSLATSVILSDAMTPKNGKQLTFLCDDAGSASCLVGTSLCDNTNTAVTGPATLTLTCNLPNLAATTTNTRYLFFQVNTAPDSSGDTHNNVATVSANEDDTSALNDAESETTSVRVRVDLGVTKTPSIATVDLNQPFNWDIVVSNNGPGTSDDSNLSDNLPAGMELTAAPAPGQGSCTGAIGATSFTCALGAINNAASVNVTVPVRVTSFPGGGSTTNTASVTTFGVDDGPGNNNDNGTVTVRRSSLAGTVYNDLNDDGVQDAGDTGIINVQLTLTGTDAYGNAVNNTVTTDGSGNYIFNNLSVSDGAGYTLTETQPVGFSDGLDSVGGVIIGGSRSTDVISGIAVAINTDLVDYDFAELGRASISGFVWLDENNDGVKDAGETVNIAGVQINLTGTETITGSPVNLTTTTAANGGYQFIDLRAGTYAVAQVQPIAWADGMEGLGSEGGTVGADQFTAVVLTNNDTGINYNFGERGASLSGSVYRDLNDDGVFDGGETGIGGATLTLTGTDIDGNPISRTTITDNSGNYSFNNLPAANGAGYQLLETQPENYSDGKDTLGTLGGILNNDDISAIPVTAGSIGTGYLFGEGIVINSSIAGIVFIDANDNGIQDIGEKGIAGVILRISGNNFEGDGVSRAVLTNADGEYLFNQLPPSNGAGYSVSEDQAAGFDDGLEDASGTLVANSRNSDVITGIVLEPSEKLIGYNFAELYSSSIAGVVYIDENDNGVQDAGEKGIESVTLILTGTDMQGNSLNVSVTTDAGGAYLFAQLPPSNATGYSVTEIQPDSFSDGLENIANSIVVGSRSTDQFNGLVLPVHTNLTDYNFAEIQNTALSGKVFEDSNDNGIQDAGEQGIPGVELLLSGTDINGNPINLTTTTDANGDYLFDALPPSDSSGYSVSEIQPEDFLDGLENNNGTVIPDSRNSDVISGIVLLPNDNQGNLNFAEVPAATLSGVVWHDDNNNGILDPNENIRIASVTITLFGTDGQGNTVERSTTTATDGSYDFTQLPSGTYSISESQPSAWADGSDQLGALGGTIGDDSFSDIQLPVGSNGLNYNFGERGGSLSGRVYIDVDNTGQSADSEFGIGGVVLSLTGIDLQGNPVNRTVMTVPSGDYKFTGLPVPDATGYRLEEAQPTDFLDGKDTAGSHGGIVTNDLITAISFGTEPVDATGYNFGEQLANPASVSGTVWLDLNHNRSDDDDGGQPSWIVELIESRADPQDETAIKVLATTTTDGNGDYLFSVVPPGTYEIHFRHPQGGYLYGTPQSTVADVYVANGSIHNLTLVSGQSVEDQDLPIDPSGVIYDATTRQPVPGATISITGPPSFDPDLDLVGGSDNVTQVTSADGFYQYLLFSSAPAGTYSLTVIEPSDYIPGVAASIPACANTPTIVTAPSPALVHSSSLAPVIGAPLHDPQACPESSAGFAASDDTTQYYLSFTIDPGLPSANVINNHIPLDPIIEGSVTVTKTAEKARVSIGDLVPYSIQVTNNLQAPLSNLNIIDQLPAGFKYVDGSGQVDGLTLAPVVMANVLTWQNQTIASGQTRVYGLLAVVGAGVAEGEFINQAWADRGTPADINLSNVGKASVQVTADPLFDCSDLIGTVFTDANVNGYQDEGETGIAGVRIATVRGLLVTTDSNGRYHIACADVPNSMRGSNFIVKVDERSLPSGYRVTTENPRVVRLTRGKVVKANFGASIYQVISLTLNQIAFEEDKNQLKPEYLDRLTNLTKLLAEKPSILRIAYEAGDQSEGEIKHNIKQLKKHISDIWHECDCHYELIIEQEIRRNTPTHVQPQVRRTGHE